MAYDVIFSNSWVIMPFSQKALLKRLMKIAFWKRAFWIQTAFLNNCQSNSNLAAFHQSNQLNSSKKLFFHQKAHATKHPHKKKAFN